jgi:carboxymethylenebutenolidase
VLFYGNHPGLDGDDFANAQAAFLGHFAENDPYEDAEEVQHTLTKLHQAGREATFHTYPGTGHWFFEPDQPDAYNPDAAQLAWERTITFLKQHLSA